MDIHRTYLLEVIGTAPGGLTSAARVYLDGSGKGVPGSNFFATITILQDGGEIEVDSRPSDAIALAVRAEAPIFADDRVIEESAIEFEGEEVNEEEIVDEFRKFLDQVTPEEFASELAEEQVEPDEEEELGEHEPEEEEQED